MKKIAIVSMHGASAYGGVERVVYYLKNILDEHYDVELIEKHKTFGKLDIIIYPVWFSLLLYFKRYDIVISQSWQAWLFPADIVVGHGTTRENINQVREDGSFGAWYISFIEGVAFRLSKKIWAVSGNCKEEIVKWYKIPENKVVVFNNFVNDQIFYPKQNLRSNAQSCRVLFCGRLSYRKGVDRVLEFAQYIEKLDDMELIIACNDDSGVKFFKGLRKTKILQGLNIEQMRKFYNSGDVLYFPSRYEGFSMAVLEALCCGLPVIGTKYALPDELKSFSFVKRISIINPIELANIAKLLKSSFCDKKNEISETVKIKFGKAQYKERLLSEIENV